VSSGEVERTQRLLSQARAGRREAFDELFDKHRAALERALRGRLPAPMQRRVDVSDIVQDALIDAYRGLGAFEYRGEGSFRSWLRAIAENRLKMTLGRHLGRARRDVGREAALATSASGPAVKATSPSSVAGRNERRALVHGALDQLSSEHRLVLRLVRMEGRSIAEAAAAMSRSENAVKKLLARALIELGAKLPRGARP